MTAARRSRPRPPSVGGPRSTGADALPIGADALPADAAKPPASQAQAIFELSRLASSGITTQELADHAVDHVATQFGAPCVALVGFEHGELVPMATRGWTGPLRASLVDPARPGDGIRVSQAQARSAGVECDSATSSELLVRGRPWAVLALHGPAGYRARPDDGFRLGVVAHFLSAARERELAHADLEHLARHDPLTGLANRSILADQLHEAVETGRASRTLIALICLDVDRFSVVNDTLGLSAGDALLTELAARLRRGVRKGDTLARYAGDKFLVLCQGLGGEGAARLEAERLRASMSGAVRVAGRDLAITASAGIALAREGSTLDELCQEADVAMYRAKDMGRGRVELFEASFQDRLTKRLEVETDLRRALDHGELQVHYQPILGLMRRNIVGAEALLRWVHPTRGIVLPGDFIPVAEDSRLIIQIGEWVLRTACVEARELAERAVQAGMEPTGISVNLSGRQIAEPEVVKRVGQALADSRLAPELLTLEITESAVMTDAEGAATMLHKLKDLGVRLSIDDFGTGYSSLSYLKRFPVDDLKIDRSFVEGLGRDPDDSVIVGAIVRLAEALGLQSVAEGVEKVRQERELRRLGCGWGQGYLFARPEPYAAFLSRLKLE